MYNRILVLSVCFTMVFVISCKNEKRSHPPNLSKVKIDTIYNFNPGYDIPKAPSRVQLTNIVEKTIPAIKKATLSDLPSVYDYIHKLSKYPDVVEILIEQYQKELRQNYDERAFILGIIGEMQRPDAFPFFREIAWSPLPKPENVIDNMSDRQKEEIVVVKSVQGIAYLRSKEAFDEIIKIILKHESYHVKISAIDTYMWNSGDTKEAADTLIKLIPSDLHKYIYRPRFTREMDAKEFNMKTEAWLKKWAKTSKGK